jgi:transposase
MKFIHPLAAETVAALQHLHHAGSSHRERQRAQAVLLSARGYKLDQLAMIFNVDRDTVSHWLDRFREHGLSGLCDAPKSGRPSKLTAESRRLIHQALETPLLNLKPVLQQRLKKGE